MAELTGEMGAEAQEALKDLHTGIEAGKKIVTATHDFETKLLAIDTVIGHIHFNYQEHEDIMDLFLRLSDEVVQLCGELSGLKKGEIHLVVLEEAATKQGTAWVLKHRKKLQQERMKEAEVDRQVIAKIHTFFLKAQEIFTEAEHLFKVDIKKAKVTRIKLELEEKEQEMKHILEQFLQFVVAYERIFKQALEGLK